MEIYLLIGVVYALFNRDPDLGIYGFVCNVALWPLGILKNVWIGWSRAKNKDGLVTKASIKQCHDSMEEFHNTLAETILEETGKGLAEQPEELRTRMLVYEIQAALAAAKKFRLERQYHRDFAAATLTRSGLPCDEALRMVDAALDMKDGSVNGADAYEQLTLGTDSLAQHVKGTLAKLQSMP